MRHLLKTPIRWQPTPEAAQVAEAVSLLVRNRRYRDVNRLDGILQREGSVLNRQIAGWRRGDKVGSQIALDFGRQSQPGIAVTKFGIERAGF
jgi:hypothetical protein